MVAMLKRMRLEVKLVEDGLQAVEAVLNDRYDLILMDIQMPTVDSFEATRILRNKGITTPIIALTGLTMKEEQNACTDYGFTKYMMKPITRQRVHE